MIEHPRYQSDPEEEAVFRAWVTYYERTETYDRRFPGRMLYGSWHPANTWHMSQCRRHASRVRPQLPNNTPGQRRAGALSYEQCRELVRSWQPQDPNA